MKEGTGALSGIGLAKKLIRGFSVPSYRKTQNSLTSPILVNLKVRAEVGRRVWRS